MPTISIDQKLHVIEKFLKMDQGKSYQHNPELGING